jgi:sec-independent protein translocase protein TatB
MVIAPTVQIASLGMADSLILMVMALVVFGPRRLPQIGRQIGKLMYEFRKASNDFKFQMEEELRNAEEADRRKKEEERLRALALTAPVPTQVEASTTPETPKTGTPGTATTATDIPGAETLNPAAVYDNGPVASTQTAETAPIFKQPTIGETVAAARGWSLKHEQARLAEASKAFGGPSGAAEESDDSRVVEPGTTPPEAAKSAPALRDAAASAPVMSEATAPENASSESDSSEHDPPVATQDAGIAVNHNG